MVYLMNVYRAYMRVEMSVKAQYRANLALWMIGALVEPIVYLIVWMNVANAQGGEIGGYTAAKFAAYYLVLLFVRQATAAPGPNMMAWRIRSGDMSFALLRPVAPLWADIAENLSHKLQTFFALIPISIVVGLAFGARLNPPLWSVLAFIPAILLASVLRFVLQYAIAILGFWMDRNDGIFSTYWTLQTFMGGMLAPLTLLPEPLRIAANLLPFKWFFAFPIDLMLGNLSVDEALIGFGAQIAWIAGSTVITVLMWRTGLKRYGAFGG
jgi:ABC-2 type transport system permease protein